MRTKYPSIGLVRAEKRHAAYCLIQSSRFILAFILSVDSVYLISLMI